MKELLLALLFLLLQQPALLQLSNTLFKLINAKMMLKSVLLVFASILSLSIAATNFGYLNLTRDYLIEVSTLEWLLIQDVKLSWSLNETVQTNPIQFHS